MNDIYTTQINESIESLFANMEKRISAEDMQRVRDAYALAAEAHKEQRRKTGEPYIIHPIAVARIVAEELELGANPVIAAFLHDVVEDTDYTIEDIRERFGDDVAFLVGVVTKQKKEKYEQSKQVDNYRQILASVQYDVRAILIKLADRLHNMRTLDSMRPDKQMKIAGETRTSMVSGWTAALTPFMYYSNPSTYFFPLYAWASVPALIVASWIFSRFAIGQKNVLIPVLAGMAVSFFIAGNLYSKVHSEGNYRLLQEEYLADNEEWERIVETADRRKPTYFISYLYLALAEQGHLLDRFPYFNPQAISSVMPPIPNIRYGMSLQSKVYLSWGYIAAARQSAFDANMMTPGMRDPRQLKILVQTNLAAGSYEVAEKYLDILERTLMYRKWAKDMRRLADDPEKVAVSLPAEGIYVRHDGLKGDLEDIVSADPSQRIALQFLEVYKMMEGMQ